jgi:hypothetical protein
MFAFFVIKEITMCWEILETFAIFALSSTRNALNIAHIIDIHITLKLIYIAILADSKLII